LVHIGHQKDGLFVVVTPDKRRCEANGTWGTAQEVRGTGA
jgi:hypothetical protein